MFGGIGTPILSKFTGTAKSSTAARAPYPSVLCSDGSGSAPITIWHRRDEGRARCALALLQALVAAARGRTVRTAHRSAAALLAAYAARRTASSTARCSGRFLFCEHVPRFLTPPAGSGLRLRRGTADGGAPSSFAPARAGGAQPRRLRTCPRPARAQSQRLPPLRPRMASDRTAPLTKVHAPHTQVFLLLWSPSAASGPTRAWVLIDPAACWRWQYPNRDRRYKAGVRRTSTRRSGTPRPLSPSATAASPPPHLALLATDIAHVHALVDAWHPTRADGR
jgi:hypothetical protein